MGSLDINKKDLGLEDQEKTSFTSVYGTFTFKRMLHGLCSTLINFQYCMMTIFSDMVEKHLEIFTDDFSVLGDSFDECLHHISLVIMRYEVTNLMLN